MGTVAHEIRTVRRASPEDIKRVALPVGMLSYLLSAVVLVPTAGLVHHALATGVDAGTEALIGSVVFGVVAAVALITIVPLAAAVLGGWLARRSAVGSTMTRVAWHAGIGTLLALPFATWMWLSPDATAAMSVTTLIGLVLPATLGAGIAGALAPRFATDSAFARRAMLVSLGVAGAPLLTAVLLMML